MATKNSYSLVALGIDGTSVPVKSATADFGISLSQEGAGSGIGYSFVTLDTQNAKISVEAADIATVYSAFGAISTVTDLQLIYAKREHGGIYDSSGCVSITLNNGVAIMRSIKAGNTGVATISYDILAATDGTNTPFTYDTADAIPEPVYLDTLYRIGPVTIGSATVASTDNSIDFGMQEFTDKPNNVPYPTHISLSKIAPKATVKTRDIAIVDTVGTTGSDSTATKTTIYFAQIDRTTGLPASGGTHISVEFTNCFINVGSISGGWTDTSEYDITITYRTSDSKEFPTISTSASLP
jgi:hypothetical protein